MMRFVEAADVTLEELLAEVGSEGTCDVVAGGRTKHRALERFAQILGFPSWSGRNLDALYELLDERAHAVTAAGRDWTLVWSPSRHLVAEHPRDYARLVAVLADVADPPRRSTRGARGSRVVIVHGAALSAPAADPAARRGDSHAPDPAGPDPHPTHQPGSEAESRAPARAAPHPTPTLGARVTDHSTRTVSLLGSTGSIGTQALQVIAAHPGRYDVVALAAGSNLELTAEQAVSTGAQLVALASGDADDLRAAIQARVRAAGSARGAYRPEIVTGEEAATVAAAVGADVVLNGITGSIGLRPTLAALAAGSVLALANKESLIVGGPLVTAAAAPGQIVPVDSEHSAIAQSLRGGRREEVRRLVVTASGGPFRGLSRSELRDVTPEQALAHPNYAMGRVVTTNSATLVNKGLEVIEAHLLFDIPFERIDVVVHPQQWIHSMVEFHDGSTVAQMGPPRMLVPIALGLSWPQRLPDVDEPCDWGVAQAWDFAPLDDDAFPAVRLARQVGTAGGTYPAVYNAANEVCVDAFHARAIGFLDIVDTVARVVDAYAGLGSTSEVSSVEQVLRADAWARRTAADLLGVQTHDSSPARERDET